MKFIKNPIVVEAFKVDGKFIPDWFMERIGKDVFTAKPDDDFSYRIETLEGQMRASKGDWIVRGINDEIYPVKDEIFRETYEEVGE